MIDPNKLIEVDPETGRVSVSTINTEPSKTQTQFADDCDVNKIMRRYERTGELVHLARTQGVYADLVGIGDYHDMLMRVQEAQEAFMTLPAEVRSRFQNDPGRLLSFIEDANNYEEGVKLGLFDAKTVPVPPSENDEKTKTTGST